MSDAARHWARVSEVFDRAVALADEERAAYLLELEAAERSVVAEARKLLEADRGGTDSLRHAAASAALSWSEGSADEVRGARLGDYRLLRPLGRGGMGEVWEAERADGQFEQRVAMKLLKRGLDSEEILSRFLRERQILARLEHPAITRLLDGGLTPDGRPFLVMERVDGLPIQQFAAERRLSLRARLELLLQVADALESAHRALVVHRDLKPSNILVTSEGRPKLLDFGIAKLLSDDGAALYETRLAGAPLTPSHAAPEQFRGGPITTATDVYGLGVVMFELLTGRRPFERHATSLQDLARDAAAEQAPRPSAVARGAAPGARPPEKLDADLDSIVLQALRPEPEQRYPSMAAFAADLRRYLAGEAVQARGDAWLYRARKFARRHGFATTALLLVLAGAGLSVWQAARATREAARAREVERFLIATFERADPSRTLGERLSARQLLDEGARRIEGLRGQPEARAALEQALARSYLGLGLYAQAEQHARRALELLDADSLEAASARVTLAEAEMNAGQLPEAEREIERALGRLDRRDASAPERARGLDVAAALDLQLSRSESALARARASFELQRAALGEDDPRTAAALQALASVFNTLGRLEEARVAYEDALGRLARAGHGESPDAALVHTNLADTLDTLGRAAEAERHFDAALRLQRKAYGDDHPELAQTLLKQGIFLVQRRRFAEADRALAQALRILEPLGHYDVANAWRYLGYSALGRERFADAEQSFERALAFLRERMGEDHPLTWTAVVSLAQARSLQGRLAEAERLQRAALAALERHHGARSNEVRTPLKNLGDTLRRAGRTEEALRLHRQALALELELFGTDQHLAVAVSRRQLALDLLQQGGGAALGEARLLLDEALAFLRATPAEAQRLPEFLDTSGRVALAAGDETRALLELREALALWSADPEAQPRAAVEARELVARLEARRPPRKRARA